jgi:hypothetical protein
MPYSDSDETRFENLFSEPDATDARAPASLKARLYSAVIRAQQATGPLASLDAVVAAGRDICVFEKLVQIAPLGERAKSPFFCQFCHSRVLAEKFDKPPIFWPGCPYAAFKNG